MFRSRFEIYQTCVHIRRTCSSPERNKVAESFGECRENGKVSVCLADGAGCFLGFHPVSFNHVVPILETKQPDAPFFTTCVSKKVISAARKWSSKSIKASVLARKLYISRERSHDVLTAHLIPS
ncbi:hypothetical protein PsorP6_018512 [Peronosclerospora sorghi]|nr:hypothetical protein PsorP6_018512 [Peronosclerospora sorghi]